MSARRCDTCRWWDNEPYREIRDAPNQEKGRYGDCLAPVPLLFGRVYEWGQDALRAETDAERCQCWEDRWEVTRQQKIGIIKREP